MLQSSNGSNDTSQPNVILVARSSNFRASHNTSPVIRQNLARRVLYVEEFYSRQHRRIKQGRGFIVVTCTYCQAENEESALICANCKQPLESITLISRGLGGSRTKSDSKHRYHLGRLNEHDVAIYIGKSEQPLILPVKTKLTLGRHRELPDPDLVDFTPYDGYKLGMSRNHAALFFKDGALCIQDLGSANGTWVNSTRLQTYDVVALISGAAISLAQVTVTIYY